jgi:hypothetical protein
MKKLLLIALLCIGAGPGDQICRQREFRCEIRCSETTPGGSLLRLRCYERCREDEFYCKREWPG